LPAIKPPPQVLREHASTVWALAWLPISPLTWLPTSPHHPTSDHSAPHAPTPPPAAVPAAYPHGAASLCTAASPPPPPFLAAAAPRPLGGGAGWGWGSNGGAGGGLLSASTGGRVLLHGGAHRRPVDAAALEGRVVAEGLGDVYAVACRPDGQGFAAGGKDTR
jgi:hypothetical protein